MDELDDTDYYFNYSINEQLTTTTDKMDELDDTDL